MDYVLTTHFGVKKLFDEDRRVVATFAFEEGDRMFAMVREGVAKAGGSIYDESAGQYVVGNVAQLMGDNDR